MRKPLTIVVVAVVMLLLLAVANSQQNHEPVVAIISPQLSTKIKASQQLYYEISVSDHEDGETVYEEIASTEVYLNLSYFAEREQALAYAEGKEEAPALTLMKAAGCFNCHAHNTNLGGPPFREIAMKYDGPSATKQIRQSIRIGSSGKWGDETIMPAHPQLTNEEINRMANWITNEQHRPKTVYLQGTSGLLTVPKDQKGHYLVLKASYQDHGDGTKGSEKVGVVGQWHLVE